jgi:hypothetical protein
MAVESPDPTALRREKAMLMLGIGVGGTLTLADGRLIWNRSLWASLGGIFDKGPPSLELPLEACRAAPGPRRPPWSEVILSFLAGGLIIPLITLRPGLWLGPFNLIALLLTGSFRKTMAVWTAEDIYNFSVKDVSLWLQDIDRAKRLSGGTTTQAGRPATVKLAVEREALREDDDRGHPTPQEQWQAFLRRKKGQTEERKPPP